MIHHTVDPVAVCPLCSEKMATAHPILQDWFERIRAAFPGAHVSWAFRDEETQELFFREGKSRARWPNSRHNRTPAEAIDLFLLGPDNVARWPKPWFLKISEWLIEKRAPIIWGGTFSSISDQDHFSLKASLCTSLGPGPVHC